MEDLILVDRTQAGVVSITLNRPDKRNALSIPMLTQLCEAVDDAARDDAVRAIVFRGAGNVFCAGLDLAEAQDTTRSHESAELVARMLSTVYHAPQVTIAAVHGAAIAGGAGLMSACDIALAAAGSKFGYPEVRRGMVAGLVMTFLRRQVAERHARELLLLGEIIDSERAVEIGLINREIPSDMLNDAVDFTVGQVLKGAPTAVRITKRFFDSLHQRPVPKDLEEALKLHVEVRNAGEAQEGMRAFTEKRDPSWAAEG